MVLLTCSPRHSSGIFRATNRYTLGGTTYDADGNLLTDTFHTYTWNFENRPVTVDAIALTYDAFGRLVEKNNGGVFNEYVYDARGKNIATMSGATLTKGLIPLPGGIQATYDPANSGYRIPDWLGSVRIASNSTRTYSSSRAFAPFGERYSSGGGTPSNYTFTGMINSTVTDEYDFLARSMQTSQGRWISADPAGLGAVNPSNPQSWNRYAYVLNNPLAFIDPLGLDCADSSSGGPASGGSVPCPGESTDNFTISTTVNAPFEDDGGDDNDLYVFDATLPVWIPHPELPSRKSGPPANNCEPPFICSRGGSDARVRAVTSTPQEKVHKITATCMGARLADNFVGPSGSGTLTVALNVAGVAVFEPAVAAMVPGPGWLYTGTMVIYDVGMIGKSYSDCKYGEGEPTPPGEIEEEPE